MPIEGGRLTVALGEGGGAVALGLDRVAPDDADRLLLELEQHVNKGDRSNKSKKIHLVLFFK